MRRRTAGGRIAPKSSASSRRRLPVAAHLPRPCAAFTLLEIVVAISIFSLIMIGVISCWQAIIKGTQAGRQAAAAAQRARVSIKTIQDALSTAEIDKNNIQFYGFVADTSSDFAILSLAARLPAAFPGSSLFGDNVMRRVTFDVERGEDNLNDLVMNQSPLLMMTDNGEFSPYPITLARDVTFFKLEFWSPTESDWMTEFLATNQFPPMIRVTLGVGHSATDSSLPYEVVTRVVAMPVLAH